MKRLIIIINLCAFFADPSSADVRDKERWTSYLDMRYVTSITFDGATAYIATTGGVGIYDMYTQGWKDPITTSDGLPDNWVRRVAFDPTSGDIWFDTIRGVARWYPPGDLWNYGGGFARRLIRKKERPQLPSLIMDLGYFFYPEGYIRDSYSRKYSVTESIQDDWGNLWIGTWGIGTGVADLRILELKLLPFGPIENNVSAMETDGSCIWFGGASSTSGASAGISRFDKNTKGWVYFEARYIDGLNTNDVTSVAVGERYVWFGTINGLSRYDKKKDSWDTLTTFHGLSDDSVIDICLDDEYLWIGTAYGLDRLHCPSGIIEEAGPDGIKRGAVYDVEVDDESVWVGTVKGIYRYLKDDGKSTPDLIGGDSVWTRITDTYRLLDNAAVTSIVIDRGEIWLAVSALPVQTSVELGIAKGTNALELSAPSIGTGVVANGRYFILAADRDALNWRRYFPPRAASSDIKDICADDGFVWIASQSGVFRLDRRYHTWEIFTEAEGLPHRSAQVILRDGEYIWFGTERGVTRVFLGGL